MEYFTLEEGLTKPYFLDKASYIAARVLDVKPGDKVLDMCAAPGGKSLILALSTGSTGSLISNDRSLARCARLKKVLNEYLPPDIRAIVRVTHHDAATWFRYEQNGYDKILLDVPCSSERHVFNSPYHLKKWSPSRTKQLSQQAYAMLASALEVVKTKGIILYCTCALSPLENDGVIAKLLAKRTDKAGVIPLKESIGEKTVFGWQIWPDTSSGLGPIYFSKIRKL
ncbi:MAG: RsmB/NOP family class I SAM-dependent RNA methyltransferase [Spirochaetota bacterium]